MSNKMILAAVTIFLLIIGVIVAVGESELKQKWMTGNPSSLEKMGKVPELPRIALPIAAILGLVFFFQQKRTKEE
jgi:hypothetical protein